MIYVGLTGWGDHPDVYSETTSARDRLFDYSGHFPVVEVDTSFYAIPSEKNVLKWIDETPDQFKFIVKGYRGMTGHLRGEKDVYFDTKADMFEAFRKAIEPFQRAGKLAAVLMQFPPWFDCQFKNVQYLRYVKQELGDFPVAIEFRNRTWYTEQYVDGTMNLLRELKFIHTVCDEPQAGEGSVPLLSIATTDTAFVRIHGRNVHGWLQNGRSQEDWRKVRCLYNYNDEELREIAVHIQRLAKTTRHVYVAFNNNSGNDAAHNAKELLEILNIHYDHLAPKQLDLFEGD